MNRGLVLNNFYLSLGLIGIIMFGFFGITLLSEGISDQTNRILFIVSLVLFLISIYTLIGSLKQINFIINHNKAIFTKTSLISILISVGIGLCLFILFFLYVFIRFKLI